MGIAIFKLQIYKNKVLKLFLKKLYNLKRFTKFYFVLEVDLFPEQRI